MTLGELRDLIDELDPAQLDRTLVDTVGDVMYTLESIKLYSNGSEAGLSWVEYEFYENIDDEDLLVEDGDIPLPASLFNNVIEFKPRDA